MSTKTLENLVRQFAPNSQPLDVWRLLHRGKRGYRPSAAALVRRATLDAEGWR